MEKEEGKELEKEKGLGKGERGKERVKEKQDQYN
eukprot:CAMPEP_0201476654 /NCGR_PEP_ID=MMETSP0151_2-20130828/1812_1 /ASSEMBLY_ACC=CAM_ASM_000257 /TAXON_ID=200890 /ORGANISM="Paramoeba atlantica, Strain 621/1 / CCAP 1560/9" /LENGTH=33 /DNA_ID= /DNA_START= /DNA_END= /DNA_ORIENTATION=